MYKVILIVFVLFSSALSFAQTAEERLVQAKVDWADTGYGFLELFNEPEFQVSECIKNEKVYLACLRVINNLLVGLEESPQTLLFSQEGEFEINALDTDFESLTTELLIEVQNEWIRNYKRAYASKSLYALDSLYKKVQGIMMSSVSQDEQAYIAGRAFNSFLKLAYDPHSGLSPEISSGPQVRNYSGIGVLVVKVVHKEHPHNGALALSPMKGSPAEAAGLKRGDLILSVDGIDILDKTVDDITSLILGVEGTNVALKVFKICSGRVENVIVKRGRVSSVPNWTEDSKFVSLEKNLDPIDEICNDDRKGLKVGEPQALYVPMSSFIHISKQPVELCKEFIYNLQVRDLENKDSLGMIIDLRGNGGGSLVDVSCMLDSIVHGQEGVLVAQQAVERGELLSSKAQSANDYHLNFVFSGKALTPYKDTAVHYNKKIVVLTDKSSASASEVFSGNIQDLERGWVVGMRTFGKGSVQALTQHNVSADLRSPVDTKLQIRRTIGIYTLNSGRSPQGFGIIPDFRFDDFGEAENDQEGGYVGEASRENSIIFENIQPVQQRPDEKKKILSCAQDEKSSSEKLKQKFKADVRYKTPFVSSYQLSLAKDVMLCMPEREPFIR